MIFIFGVTIGLVLIGLFIWGKEALKAHSLPFILMATVYTALSVAMFAGISMSQGQETQILNGRVLEKFRDTTSCEHSYSCNCRTVKSGNTTSTKCDTCYEHFNDYDWVVKSDVGKVYIKRIDDQGKKEPPRFTDVQIGEPFSVKGTYYNFIKASPLSVFKDYGTFKNVATPNYPDVYDYYRINRVVNWNSAYTKDFNVLNDHLNKALKTTSPLVKANVIVVFYSGSDDIINATKVKNLGGKINDVTVFIKANKDGLIEHVGVYSWSKNDMVNTVIRDEILDIKTVDHAKISSAINNNLLKYYKHRSIKEFEYLKHNVEMPTWYYVLQGFLCVLYIVANILIRRKM